MFEQDFSIAICVFQDLVALKLCKDWLCSFWLEIDILVSDVTPVFKADKVFIGFVSCLVIDCDVVIHTHRYEWCINHSVLVNTLTVFLFSFQQLEGCPRKRR